MTDKNTNYEAMDAAIEIGRHGIERMVNAVSNNPSDHLPDLAQAAPMLAELLAAGQALYDAIGDVRADERPLQNDGVLRAGVAWCKAAALAAQPPAAPVETAIMEATEAQHTIPRQEGRPAQFTRNGKLETCQCSDCRRLSRSSAATEGVVGLEVLRHMADRQRGIGMPPKPMVRPSGSNADEWNVFLEEYTGHGNSFIAVQIAEAIEDAEKRGTLNEPQSLSRDERHAVEHARYQVQHASPDNPDCHFDYGLVLDLVRAIDRAYPLSRPHHQSDNSTQEK